MGLGSAVEGSGCTVFVGSGTKICHRNLGIEMGSVVKKRSSLQTCLITLSCNTLSGLAGC